MEITHQDVVISKLEQAKQQGLTQEDVIEDFVEEHRMIESDILEGERYYYAENDIKDKKIYKYEVVRNDQGIIIDREKKLADEKANNRYPHAFHKILVDQKVQYLYGKPLSISVKEGVANKDRFEEEISSLFKDLSDVINDLATDVSNIGRGFIHPRIKNLSDGTVEFDYVIIPYDEIIPIYDTTFDRDLKKAIRYYDIMNNGETITRVELWDSEKVTYFKIVDGSLIKDSDMETNPEPYFTYGDEAYTWNSGIPLIEFKNNKKKTSDLVFYKGLIDGYDKNFNKLFDNVDDVQEIILMISGASATDPDELRTNFNYHKMIKTDEGGNAKALEVNIPYETRKVLLDKLEQNIFVFGQGVNYTKDEFGNDKSGVALNFLYGALEQKASKMERNFNKGLNKLAQFGTEYLNIVNGTDYDNTDVIINNNKLKIVGDKDLVEMLSKSESSISRKTIIENHPLVDDVKEEMNRLFEEGISGGYDE